MNKKIKKFFYSFINSNKKELILSLLSFVIFGLIFSPQLALAQIPGFECQWYDVPCRIGNFVLTLLIKIVVLLSFGIPLLISMLFIGIMCLILGWIISPAFISLKFTNNPFVNAGLSITRGFSNLGFIVFLVAIGLATALRIEEYKAKKTLPLLIIVALLINFSPVFCGVIIDASNIVMNFFLEKITGIEGFMNIVYMTGNAVVNLLGSWDLWSVISAVMVILVLIVFNFFAGFIFILFSALFIMRYIMLWILVILSPIAFVSYILPVTRHGKTLLSWRNWWEQLVAWAIIGIIAGFFLYLGFLMIAIINNNPGYFTCLPGDTNPDGTPKCGPGLGLMNNVVPYLIPLVLLWIAYRETKKTSAMFAGDIISATEKVTKGATMAAAIATMSMVAAPVLKRVEGYARPRLEKVPVVGKAIGGPGAYEAQMKKTTAAEKKKLEDRSSESLQEFVDKRPLTQADRYRRAAAMEILATRGKLKDEHRTHLKEARRYGADVGEILKARPDWAPEVGKNTREIVEKMTPGELTRRVQHESLKSVEVFYAMNIRQAQELGRRGTRLQKEAVRNLIIAQQASIQTQINALRATGVPGNIREADKIRDVGNYIHSNPNYVK